MIRRPTLKHVMAILAIVLSTMLGRTQQPDSVITAPITLQTDSLKKVYLSTVVINLPKVDASEEGFFVNLFYRVRWYDPVYAHLKDTMIVKPLHEVWHPDIQLVNQKRIFDMLPKQVVITGGGEVFYRQRIYGELAQGLNLVDFPFDSQEFNIQLGSPGLLAGRIEIIPDPQLPSAVSSNLTLSDWDMLDQELIVDSIEVAAGMKVVGATMRMRAQRKTGYFVINIIIPLALIVIMSWSIFWLDPKETGTRVTVAITAMLTIIAYRFVVSSLLPQISYLTRMDFFVLACSIMIFMALFVVMLGRLGIMKPHVSKIDLISRFLFPAAFAVVILMFIF